MEEDNIKDNNQSEHLIERDINSELKESYIDYAMSVIVSRALPDVRDGLKPVHRRILYTIYEDKIFHSGKFRKSATVVGSCLGRYHPHGDVAVYDSLVRMAQDFSLRYPLIEGQGNFGSIDGDPPAAMRYSEVRLSEIAGEMLKDIEKDTVDFIPNFDNTRKEPTVLPSLLPQLLINGSIGIAVGTATSIPPHNLKEVCEAILYFLDNSEAKTSDLLQFIKGPDFPTGGIVLNKNELKEIYSQGRGLIKIRAKAEIVEKKENLFNIIITEIPYNTLKSTLLEKIAELAKNKKIDGIRNIRDESDRRGLRVVIELKKDVNPKKVLNKLYKFTDLQKTFGLNMVALVDGIQPRTLSLKDVLVEFINHRKEVIRRRTKFDIQKIKERLHILEGLARALENIDEIIKIIKKSKDRNDAKINLMKKFKFTEIQANAILEIKLQTLARMERESIEKEYKEKKKILQGLIDILEKPEGIINIIKEETQYIRDKYQDERKTQILNESSSKENIEKESLIPEEENILILTEGGYIKRMNPKLLRSQKRGGNLMLASAVRKDDQISLFLNIFSNSRLLFFTNFGKVFSLEAYEIPESDRYTLGRGILNFLELERGEKITGITEFNANRKKQPFLVFLTKQGIIKKVAIDRFENVRRTGMKAINLQNNDELLFIKSVNKGDEIIILSNKGLLIRFKEKNVREMGRNASGVRAMRLKEGEFITGLEIINKQEENANYFLVISDNGFGKRIKIDSFKVQTRGGRGIISMKTNKKIGQAIALKKIFPENEEIIVVTQKGKSIRTKIKSIPILGRSAQGVRIIKLNPLDKIKSLVLL